MPRTSVRHRSAGSRRVAAPGAVQSLRPANRAPGRGPRRRRSPGRPPPRTHRPSVRSPLTGRRSSPERRPCTLGATRSSASPRPARVVPPQAPDAGRERIEHLVARLSFAGHPRGLLMQQIVRGRAGAHQRRHGRRHLVSGAVVQPGQAGAAVRPVVRPASRRGRSDGARRRLRQRARPATSGSGGRPVVGGRVRVAAGGRQGEVVAHQPGTRCPSFPCSTSASPWARPA